MPHYTKRDFIKMCGSGLCALSLSPLLGVSGTSRAQTAQRGLIKTRLSPYYRTLRGGHTMCLLCPRRCRMADGERGYCGVRENRDGEILSLVYGNPCAIHLDPIEKKPFFHVLPGTKSLSIATAGCNFACKFCQNWEIAFAPPEDVFSHDVGPEKMVQRACAMGARSMAYTYVEPTVFFEYMFDVAQAARGEGLLNVMHSNGFISKEPLGNLCGVLDAAQVDLKGFSEDFYRELCDGQLAPVLESLRILNQRRVHLEITNLVIPTKNDDMAQIRKMCIWVKEELGSDIPLHFSRFYPLFRLKRLPPTPVRTLEKARTVAMSVGLEYVYIANVPGHEAANTFCPKCGKMVIQRTGYMIGEIHLKEGRCKYCGLPIPGIWP